MVLGAEHRWRRERITRRQVGELICAEDGAAQWFGTAETFLGAQLDENVGTAASQDFDIKVADSDFDLGERRTIRVLSGWNVHAATVEQHVRCTADGDDVQCCAGLYWWMRRFNQRLLGTDMKTTRYAQE